MNYAPVWFRASSLATAVVVLALAPDALAKGGAKPAHVAAQNAQQHRAAMPHNRNSTANQNNGQVISRLSSTLATLAKADHDYSGHRAKAMQHLNTAIRHLEPASVRNNQPNLATLASNSAGTRTGTGGTSKKNSLSQATSDKHLNNALQSLNSIGDYIANNGTAPNHAKALQSVQQAIQELNTALNIR